MRDALLEAARDLFLRHGYRAVSSRQIAAAAGANVAMIRYYFGGKSGLYREMLEDVLAPVREYVDSTAAQPASADFGALIALMMRTHAAHPWVSGLVLREVLSPGGVLRAVFLREIGGRLVPAIQRVIDREIERGTLRPVADSRLILLSMVSLAVFPYLAFAVTSRVFGVSRDEESVQQLVRHTQDLLLRGLGPRGGSE